MKSNAPISIGLLLVACLAPAVVYPANASAFPATNDGHWRKYFRTSDFSKPEIASLVRKFEHGKDPDPVLAGRIAEYGAAALPYLFRLSGERSLHFFAFDMKGGLFGWFTEHPYDTRACMVISKIRATDSIPELKRVMNASIQGGCARKALFAMNATFTRDEVLKAFESDQKNYSSANLLLDYTQMMRGWSDSEAVDFVLNVYVKKALSEDGSWGLKETFGLIPPGQSTILWERLYEFLRTKNSRKAEEFLNQNYRTLGEMKADFQTKVSSPDAYVSHTSSEIDMMKAELPKIDGLMSIISQKDK